MHEGSQASKSDTLFIQYVGEDILLILKYAIDILITGSIPSTLNMLFSISLQNLYSKDLKEFNYFVGLEFTLFVQGLQLS